MAFDSAIVQNHYSVVSGSTVVQNHSAVASSSAVVQNCSTVVSGNIIVQNQSSQASFSYSTIIPEGYTQRQLTREKLPGQ